MLTTVQFICDAEAQAASSKKALLLHACPDDSLKHDQKTTQQEKANDTSTMGKRKAAKPPHRKRSRLKKVTWCIAGYCSLPSSCFTISVPTGWVLASKSEPGVQTFTQALDQSVAKVNRHHCGQRLDPSSAQALGLVPVEGLPPLQDQG